MQGGRRKIFKDPADRGREADQYQNDWGHGERDPLGVAGRQAFGRDLAENQNNDSQDANGNTRTHASKGAGCQDRGKCGGADIDEIVTDQDRDQHTCRLLF